MQDGRQDTNFRIYGCENKKGWVKITEVEKHDFKKNQDEPFTMGNFSNKTKIKQKR